MANRPPYPGTPRWVKVFGIIAIVVVLLVVFMLLTGHGPGRHMPSGDAGGQVAAFSVMEEHALPEGGHG
jgi:ABC-type transporter Mla subunit MlaD